MKKITILLTLGAVLSGCSGRQSEEGKAIILEHTALAGSHCESSAILNALNYLEYEISEEQIIGAGAAPGFVYEKGKFPFLGGRNIDLRESFSASTGVEFTLEEDPGEPQWDEIEKLLERGVPVILRVDMRYLPYLHGGKYGSKYTSFGWHIITLFSLDRTNDRARVSDTAYRELKYIKVRDLEKARFSKTEVYPPRGDYYWFERSLSPFEPDWTSLAEKSLIKYARTMKEETAEENLLSGLSGLKALADEIRALPERAGPYMIIPVLEFHYGCIETNGTGGAAFRSMYNRFLNESLNGEENREILRGSKTCEEAWHNLAQAYKNAAALYKDARKKQKRELIETIAVSADSVYRAEAEFIDIISKKYI